MAGARIPSYGASLAAVADRFRTEVPGAVYGNFFGEGASVGRNLADGGIKPIVAGSPLSGDYYADFVGGSAFVNTGLDQPDSYTYLFVSSALADVTPQFVVGNYMHGSGAVSGSWFYFDVGTAGDGILTPRFGNAFDNAGAATVNATPQGPNITYGTAPMAYACRYNRESRTKTLNALTTNTPKATIAQAGDEIKRVDGLKLMIGSAVGLGTGTTSRVYCAWIWPRALTDDELAKQHAQVRAFYARRGISV